MLHVFVDVVESVAVGCLQLEGHDLSEPSVLFTSCLIGYEELIIHK